MVTRFQQQVNMPYSLHDMVVNSITCKNGTVCLEFEHGFVSAKEPYPQVDGKITVENVDMDSACVLLLSEWGKYGKFDGAKVSLSDFVKQHGKCSFEIVDEMYGFHQVEYIGYLYLPEGSDSNSVQMSLSMYFDGDIVYETEESSSDLAKDPNNEN